ncbi:MAG: hypothetical protein JKX82_03165 [Oleispira sp.]|nr:hypothetical protein [Oleispira sp.]
MGRIICENHGENSIVQMSKVLHNKFLKKENSSIIKLVFRLNGFPDFIHYFSSDENIKNLLSLSNENEFELAFSGFSGDPGACENCFKDYLNDSNNETQERIIEIGNE